MKGLLRGLLLRFFKGFAIKGFAIKGLLRSLLLRVC